MKRTDLGIKQIIAIVVIISFISALVYVSFFNVEVAETVVEQPITLKTDS